MLNKDNTILAQGLSAIIIMLFHYAMEIDGYPRFINILGSICVAVFLFISGFGLNESYKKSGLTMFWRKRFFRVMLPFWIVLLVNFFLDGAKEPAELLKNIFFTDSKLWFVDYIMRWYAIYWLARKLATRYTTLILTIASVAFIFTSQLMSEQAFSFLLGYLASEHYERVCSWSKRRITTIVLVAAAYGIAFTLLKEIPCVHAYKGTLLYHILLLNIKLPLALSVIAAPCLMSWLKDIKPLNYFGKISYELYIVHFSFIPFITGITSLVGFSLLSIIISAVFYRFNHALMSFSMRSVNQKP